MDGIGVPGIDTRTGRLDGEQRRPVDTAAAGSASASASTTGTLALPDLSRLLADLSAHIGLRYTIDQDTRRPIVQVVDRYTNEVLREIPSQEARKLAAAMRDLLGVLFDLTV